MMMFSVGKFNPCLRPAMIEVTEVSLWEILLFHTGLPTNKSHLLESLRMHAKARLVC